MHKNNIYVDEHLAIEYSIEYEFLPQPGFGYTLSRGNKLICVYTWSREDWDWHKQSRFTVVPQPGPKHPEAPTTDRVIEPFAYNMMSGEALWWKMISPNGKLLMAGANVFVRDGAQWLELRFDDNIEISVDVVQSVLESISFPGQPKYSAAIEMQQSATEFDSPYAIELKHFSTLGVGDLASPKKINFRYSGEQLSEAQRGALDQFLLDESTLFEDAIEQIYEQYTEVELPALEEIRKMMPEVMLPNVSQSEDLLPHLVLSGIQVHLPRSNGDVPIGLSLDPSWTDNGIGVLVVGEEIEAVGEAYVAFEESAE